MPGNPVAEREYRTAFLDWLACAVRGSLEARGLLTSSPLVHKSVNEIHWNVATFGMAGHVLDYDDTYPPGLSHISAATAPVALMVASALDLTVGEMLHAYAEGFEAMARLTEACHPMLYDHGLHPTAVCGATGAAVTASSLLDLDRSQRRSAVRLAMLSGAGLRSAFGSHGKAFQVGRAASDGLMAAQFAAAGAQVGKETERGPASFFAIFGGREVDVLEPASSLAIGDNWLKAYPCCLQTHAGIDAGIRLAELVDVHGSSGLGMIVVHPVSLQAAKYGVPNSPLQAKFSIPYTMAYAMLRGSPGLDAFRDIDQDIVCLAQKIRVRSDSSLDANECVAHWSSPDDDVEVRIEGPLGSPKRPMTYSEHTNKVTSLAGQALLPLLGDDSMPVREIVKTVAVCIPS